MSRRLERALFGRFDEAHTETNTRFDQTNGRIDEVRAETIARCDQTNKRIDELRTETNTLRRGAHRDQPAL